MQKKSEKINFLIILLCNKGLSLKIIFQRQTHQLIVPNAKMIKQESFKLFEYMPRCTFDIPSIFFAKESTLPYCAEVKILKQEGFQSLGTSLGVFLYHL